MYARRNGLERVMVYFDTPGNRSQFERMTAESGEANPPFRCTLVTGYDRFAGSQEEFQGWTEWLNERGVSVISITGPPGDAQAG